MNIGLTKFVVMFVDEGYGEYIIKAIEPFTQEGIQKLNDIGNEIQDSVMDIKARTVETTNLGGAREWAEKCLREELNK